MSKVISDIKRKLSGTFSSIDTPISNNNAKRSRSNSHHFTDFHFNAAKVANFQDTNGKLETMPSTYTHFKTSPKSLHALPSRKFQSLQCVEEGTEKPLPLYEAIAESNIAKHEASPEKQDHSIEENMAIHQKPYTCPICYGDYDQNEITNPLGCGHFFCLSCIDEFLRKQIDEFNVLKLKCPQDQCTCLFTDINIQAILNKETFELYQHRKLLKLRNQDILLKYCPKPGCTKPFYPKANVAFTQCECGTVICHSCFNERHDGKTCLEAAAGGYELYHDNADIRKCIICKTIIEKQEGCSHVICPVCDYDWCWHCGREWEPGHGSRCLNKWNPIEPKAFRKTKNNSIIDQACNAVFLTFEIILYALSSALGIILVWPCIMTKEFGSLLPKNVKSKAARNIFGIIVSVISWPGAILIYPICAVTEEYGTCCRRRRWRKGTSAKFGFTNQSSKSAQRFRLNLNKRPTSELGVLQRPSSINTTLKMDRDDVVTPGILGKDYKDHKDQLRILKYGSEKPPLEIVIDGKVELHPERIVLPQSKHSL